MSEYEQAEAGHEPAGDEVVETVEAVEFDVQPEGGLEREMESDDEPGDGDEEFALVLESEPELPLPVWEPTGDAAVDAALDELMRLDQLGTAEHVDVYGQVHAALYRRLSDLEA